MEAPDQYNRTLLEMLSDIAAVTPTSAMPPIDFQSFPKPTAYE